MLWTILVALVLIWLIAFYGGFVTAGWIHILLLGALVVFVLNLFKRRYPV